MNLGCGEKRASWILKSVESDYGLILENFYELLNYY